MSRNIRLETDLKNVAAAKVDIDKLWAELGLQCTISKDYLRIALANALMFDRKHRERGPSIATEFGMLGQIMRIGEKYLRLKTQFKVKRSAMNESIEDSFRDVVGHASIALMIDQNLWH